MLMTSTSDGAGEPWAAIISLSFKAATSRVRVLPALLYMRRIAMAIVLVFRTTANG